MKLLLYFFILILFLGNANAQNIGIGTATPDAKLHINGSFKITNGSQGNGKVLTSDASGLASWKSALDTGAYYPAVGICCATWMTKNLDIVTYRNGDTIPQITDATAWASLTTGAWCYPNNDAANGLVNGKLYNGYAVKDVRGLAPFGWHIPTDFEWTTLYNCLGGDAALGGGALKQIGLTNWGTPNTAATNLSGFSAFGTGFRQVSGSFESGPFYTSFWSFTNVNETDTWWRSLYSFQGLLARNGGSRKYGLSVRCVKD
jgi:uncharacterized protein (TIGR02145 family)